VGQVRRVRRVRLPAVVERQGARAMIVQFMWEISRMMRIAPG